MENWIGKQMMNPEGKIGKVIKDDNEGTNRILTIKFDNNKIEYLILNNIGDNSPESSKWKWFFDRDKEWVEWGF